MTTVEELRSALRRGAVDIDLVWSIADLFRRWLSERSGGRAEGTPEELLEVELDQAAIDALHADLVAFARRDLGHPQAGVAIWAAGKLARRGDEPLFAAALEHGLGGDDGLLHQALIALENLGALPADVTSLAAHEAEVNRGHARRYLDARGTRPSAPGERGQ